VSRFDVWGLQGGEQVLTSPISKAHHRGTGGDLVWRCSSHRDLQTSSRLTGANIYIYIYMFRQTLLVQVYHKTISAQGHCPEDMASSWEGRDYSHLDQWDARAYDDDPNVESDDEHTSAEESSQCLFDLLVQYKMVGVLSAKAVCTIAHWATLAGMKGKACELSLAPSRTGGAFSSHFDKVLGLDVAMKDEWYTIAVPSHCKYDASRTLCPLTVKPAYESIAEEIEQTPDMFERLRSSVVAGQWCSNYTDNEIVKNNPPGSVLPLGLYLDGVQYQKRDSTIGIWAINLLTSRRHLLVCIAKRGLCRCGCHGYCTLYPVLAFVEWCFATMVAGNYPARRHDGPWPVDSKHLSFVGQPLGFLAVPIIIKGDWAEFNSTLCFRSWHHHTHPCFKCFATGGDEGTFHQHHDISPMGTPWADKSMIDFEQACTRCEILVRICNLAQLGALVGNLAYDKRKQGARGRTIQTDMPMHSLLKHDRLEPTIVYPDIAAVDSCTVFPIVLTFWRQSSETLCTHRCGLFSRRSGLLPESLCVDELHTMHLGVIEEYNLAVFWQMLDSDALGVRGGLPKDAYHEIASLKIRAELLKWYSLTKRADKAKPLYQLQDFRMSMLGSSNKRSLSGVKAAESGTLLAFCAENARKYEHILPGGKALAECGRCLLEYLSQTRSAPLRVPPPVVQNISDALVRYCFLQEKAQIPWKPKVHLSTHMIKDMTVFGNPFLNGTWLDEGLNAKLAAVAKSAHVAVWSRRIMASFGHEAGPTAQACKAIRKKPRLAP
jgi:hypothetical protein